MIEEFLFILGCPHCNDGVPAIVTMSFMEPMNVNYGHIAGVNREEFIEAHQSHRVASIMACRKLEVEDEGQQSLDEYTRKS